MKLDDKNNLVQVCLFESHLARYFVENPQIFRPLKEKVLSAIEQTLSLNKAHSRLNRLLFSVFTTVAETYPYAVDFARLKQSQSLVVFDTFIKYFIERALSLPNIVLPKQQHRQSAANTFFHEQCPLNRPILPSKEELIKLMRPDNLFEASHRGVFDANQPEEVLEETTNLGILSLEDTPLELTDCFLKPHVPCRQLYRTNEDSIMAKWLRAHYLPVISGASGGIGKTLSGLASLLPLSKQDCQLFGLLLASSTVALGHHSFFEVMRPLSFLTGTLSEQVSLLAFYEQVIPEDIKKLPSYQQHISSEFGSCLIEPLTFAVENCSADTLS